MGAVVYPCVVRRVGHSNDCHFIAKWSQNTKPQNYAVLSHKICGVSPTDLAVQTDCCNAFGDRSGRPKPIVSESKPNLR